MKSGFALLIALVVTLPAFAKEKTAESPIDIRTILYSKTERKLLRQVTYDAYFMMEECDLAVSSQKTSLEDSLDVKNCRALNYAPFPNTRAAVVLMNEFITKRLKAVNERDQNGDDYAELGFPIMAAFTGYIAVSEIRSGLKLNGGARVMKVGFGAVQAVATVLAAIISYKALSQEYPSVETYLNSYNSSSVEAKNGVAVSSKDATYLYNIILDATEQGILDLEKYLLGRTIPREA